MNKTYLTIITILSLWTIATAPLAFQQARTDVIIWASHQNEFKTAGVIEQADKIALMLPVLGK